MTHKTINYWLIAALVLVVSVAIIVRANAFGMADCNGSLQAVDWDSSSGFTCRTLPPIQAYEGTTQRLNAFPIYKSATVSSGTAVFYLTSDNTSGGAALFPNGIIQDSISVIVNDAAASYQMSWALTNSNKTLTVTSNKLTTANILSGILGQAAANGAVIKLQVWGY